MAFDAAAEYLYVCDLKHAAVFRLGTAHRARRRRNAPPARWTSPLPNYPAFAPDGSLYVSDSHAFRDPGPGVWRVDPEGRAAGKESQVGSVAFRAPPSIDPRSL